MKRADFIAAAVTGATSCVLWDCLDPGAPFEDLDFTTARDLCAGCIDAPDLLVVGGAKAVFIEGELEAITPRTRVRG